MSLRVRTITALIFGVIMIGGTLLTRETSAFLYVLVGILCLWELSGLVFTQDSRPPYNVIRRVFAVFLGIFPSLLLLFSWFASYPIFSNGNALLFFPLLFIPFILELRARSSKPFENIAFNLLGLLYIGLPTALLTVLSLEAFEGRFIIMAVVLLIWANDVFAYFAGSAFGKHKIFPNISPNKTWEGTIGGFTAALLWGVVSYFMWFIIGYELWQWLVLGAVCSIFGIIGDLVASLLKRSLHIKDTGSILPGHGGLIDRFDAFIFATPFVTYVIVYLFNDPRFFAILW